MALQKFSKWTRAGVRGSALLNVMIDAAGKAGRNLVRHFHDIDGLQVSTKGPMEFATEADRRAEHILFESLSKARKNVALFLVRIFLIDGSLTLLMARLIFFMDCRTLPFPSPTNVMETYLLVSFTNQSLTKCSGQSEAKELS